jgi:hypothetical protein
MYKIINLLFNFNTGTKHNFQRDITWGVIIMLLLSLFVNIYR